MVSDTQSNSAEHKSAPGAKQTPILGAVQRFAERVAARYRLWRWQRRRFDTYELPPRRGPTEFHRVLARELEYIHRHRHPDQPDSMTQRSLVGLALSGGGIRSATTNLGILQALSRMEILPLVDYMSTVSGGGYIGTCLSALLSWNGNPPDASNDPCARFKFAAGASPTFSTAWEHLPFRAEYRKDLSKVGSDIVAHLRTHGNFLVAHLGVLTRHTLRGVGNFLTGILLNVSVFLLVLFLSSVLYMAAAQWAAPELGETFRNRGAGTGVPDTARGQMIDIDSTVVRVRSTKCAPGDPSCQVEIRTARQAPTLSQRIKRNARVVVATFRKFFRRDSQGLAASSTWSLGASGRFFPLALPLALGAGLAVATFLLIGLALKRYLRGEAAHVSKLKRGESVEDAFERRVLTWLAGLTALIVFGTLALTRELNPDALKENDQLLWLFVPFAVIASTRIVSILIAVLLLPWLGAHFWNRRMRSLWGAFQAIAIYGWWLLLVMALMPVAIYALRDQSLAVGISAFGSLLLTRLLTSKRVTEGSRLKILAGRFRNTLLGILVVLVLTLGLLFFSAFLAGHNLDRTALWGVVIALTAFGLFVDTNKLGPHYFYRDRLAETYLLSELPDPRGRLGVYHDAMEMPLRCLHGDFTSNAAGSRNTAPYQLISAAINLAGSRDLTRKDRKSGYWLFSKLYCGSVHTGFRETAYYRGGETLLARTVAISGAAASAAIGRFTFFAQAFATVLFNIRLGHWLENPRFEASMRKQENWVFWPRYLWREVTMKTTETTRLVNLSDGGHTGDNVGIYPLFQRRCKVIIACDAECDPRITFGSFTEALRHAYIDMGISVDIDLTMIRPDRVTGLSRSHCAVGRIKYPDREDQESYLIYLKNSLTGDEPEPQLNYKTQSPDFPHESTADLFFDDSQFESYRALGVHIAETTFGSWVTTDLFDLIRRHHAPESKQDEIERLAEAEEIARIDAQTAKKRFWEKPMRWIVDPETGDWIQDPDAPKVIFDPATKRWIVDPDPGIAKPE